MSGRFTATDVARWADELSHVAERIAQHFARPEPRLRAVAYIRALLGDAERKNGWQLAEQLGAPTPDGVQHLLARAHWDADAVRDDLVDYVFQNLGSPDGVLVVDETGFLKKGTQSCGVARQYSGTAGRIENSQVGVFLAYASSEGHALIARSLYLPKEWTDDVTRCRQAGVPESVEFATKPQLARAMIERVGKRGQTVAWVTADSAYGHDGKFRHFLQSRGQSYVLAVPSNQPLFDGESRATVAIIADELPASAWFRASAGAGSKGPRDYDWAVQAFGSADASGHQLWMVVRRHREQLSERAYYFAWGPATTDRSELIRVAGMRWCVEECLELAKGDCGLDE
jgi:SRSO17 transposase